MLNVDRATVPARSQYTRDATKRMAVAQHLQSKGLGTVILAAGIQYAIAQSKDIVWARARDSAIAFYQRNGFSVVGDMFMDDATGMPHHLVMLDLATS